MTFSAPCDAAIAALPLSDAHRAHLASALATLPTGLRDPHVEHSPRGEDGVALVRFTWNRGHYLDFAVLADGRFEWFYDPEPVSAGELRAEGSDDPVAELPPRFRELLRHALREAVAW